MKITYNEALKDIRKEARDNNCTVKLANYTINGKDIYQVKDEFNRVVHENTFWTLYEDFCAGYIQYS